ncbi:MAG TPA: hypothetical protein VFK79_17375 [Xanthobacteraceae bacterium]|nr:hypothetical protein [Xanthobacteraceae bacterium]
MRKTLVATAAAAILSAGAFLASGANAMTLTAPAGMRLATEGANVAEPIRHRCYRERYSGRLVCPRHRRVVVAPGYGYGYPAYGYGYYGSPYYYGPTVGIGLGYGWGGYGYGWGGHRTVVHRHVVRRHRR